MYLNSLSWGMSKILTFKEREVIKMRSGITGISYSLKEIVKIFCSTSERILQIEASAKRKLQLEEKYFCNCRLSDIMSDGCQCGGN